MPRGLDQFLYSAASIVIGGGIAISTQWIIARQKQKSENRERLRTAKLDKYSTVWTWLCNYDKPSTNLESVHYNWVMSHEKYCELRGVVLSASPFLSAAMSQTLDELLNFWESDLVQWRGSQQISNIRDRIDANVKEYNERVNKVFSVSQSEIKTIFDLEE
jgi:hypothetical protein